MREKLFEGRSIANRLGIRNEDRRGRFQELSHDLKAERTGKRRLLCIRHDDDTLDLAGTFRDGSKNCHALGAHGTSVAGILDVTAANQTTLGPNQCGTHPKLRVRRMGAFSHGFGQRECFSDDTIERFWIRFHVISSLGGASAWPH